MAIRTEISLRLGNSPGALARVCHQLSREHVNIIALHLESSGRLRLVADNPLHAAGLLRDHGEEIEQRDVLYVTLPNSPGAGSQAARLLGDAGVNIEYAYSAAVEGAPMAAVVFGVADAQRASAAAGM
jgi:hypothetical protein